MKSLKIVILIIILIIICVISALLIIIKNNKGFLEQESDFVDTEFQMTESYEPDSQIIQVKEANKYYAIEKILNTYIMDIKEVKGIIGFQKYDDAEVMEDGVTRLYSILDDDYIKEQNIQKEDLKKLIKEYTEYNLIIKKMYVYEVNASINLYFVYFTIDNEDCKLLIKTDSNNMTYTIFLKDFLDEKAYNENMKIQDINISTDQIQKNNYNQYKYTNITDEYLVNEYMESIKYNLLNNVEYTYKSLMENDYKEKKFGNINNFMKYINENREKIENITPKEYSVNERNGYKEYICIDKNGCYYVVKEKAVMDYTVMLDIYTLDTPEFLEVYNSAKDYEKVGLNIQNVFTALNDGDYKYVYDKLDETFKNNNYKTQADFEKYIKSKLYANNQVIYKGYEQSGDIYIYTLEITDKDGKESRKINMQVVMALGEKTDFTMSFSIK